MSHAPFVRTMLAGRRWPRSSVEAFALQAGPTVRREVLAAVVASLLDLPLAVDRHTSECWRVSDVESFPRLAREYGVPTRRVLDAVDTGESRIHRVLDEMSSLADDSGGTFEPGAATHLLCIEGKQVQSVHEVGLRFPIYDGRGRLVRDNLTFLNILT